jgi:hypothetical protein
MINLSTPENLTQYSDIIVIGTVESDNDMNFIAEDSPLYTKITLKIENIIKGDELIKENEFFEFYSASGYAKGTLYNKSKPASMLDKMGRIEEDSYILIQNENCIIPQKGDKLMVFTQKHKFDYYYSIGLYEGILYVKNNNLFYNNMETSFISVDDMLICINNSDTAILIDELEK